MFAALMYLHCIYIMIVAFFFFEVVFKASDQQTKRLLCQLLELLVIREPDPPVESS